MKKKKDVLREKNYGIPIGEVFTKTWRSFSMYPKGSKHRSKCPAYYRFVNDNDKLLLRRGDIIQFPNNNFSKTLRGQFAVVLDRYVLVKFKYDDFEDYCVVALIISGPDKGKVRRFSSTKVTSHLKQVR